MIPKPQRTNIDGNVTLSRVQDQLAATLDDIVSRPGLDHQLLRGVKLLASATTHVPHRLGRNLLGWTVTRLRASATVWDAQDANRSPSLQLDLHTSADVVVDVMVF